MRSTRFFAAFVALVQNFGRKPGGLTVPVCFAVIWFFNGWAVQAQSAISIDALPPLSILENASATNVDLTGITGGGALGVAAASSDSAVLPDPVVTYNSGDAAGTLTLTPMAYANGSATITVTVTNEVDTNISSFVVTVQAVNQAPSFTLATNLIAINEDAGPISMPNFASNLSVGPPNEASQSFGFVVTVPQPSFFSVQPQVDTSGTLTFVVSTNAYGTNTFAIVMHDDGTLANGGVDASTNYFTLAVASVYDPPVITGITSLLINENTGGTNIQLLVTAIENPVVTVTVQDSDTNLFSAAIAGPNTSTNRTLTITTVTNQYGTGVVTLVASDGFASTTNTLEVDIQPIIHPPTTSKISNARVLENSGPTNFSFTVDQFRGNVTNLTVAASAYSTNLVANANLALSGDGTNRTLQVTPNPDAFGQTLISLVVSDTNNVSSTNSFVLAISGVNQAPSFTLQTNLFVLDENAGAQSFTNVAANMSAGPPSESGQTFKFNLSYANSAIFSVPPVMSADGSLVFTPKTNTYGFVPVTVTMQDNGGTNYGGQDTSVPAIIYIAVRYVAAPPIIGVTTNLITIARDKSTNVPVILTDSGRTKVLLTAQALDTNVVAVTLTGTGMNRTLKIQPVTPTNGTTTITLTANDGLMTSSTNVQVAVSPVNYAPVLSPLAALAINEDAAPTNLSFTVNDLDTCVANVLVTVKVSNTNLATASIADADYTNRVLTITPQPDVFGSTTVELTANDQTGTTTATATSRFMLTLNPANHPPSFALAASVVVVGENPDAKGLREARTITNLVTSVSAGPANERSQKVSLFALSSSNAFFATPPSITASGNLSFKTALYATGTVVLSIYARDNGGTNHGGVDVPPTNTLTLTVTNVDQAPVIAKLANLTVNEGCGPTNIAIPATDVDTAFANLNINATCNKPMLASVSAAKGATNLYVTITPAGHTNSATLVNGKVTGSAVIMVLVDDGSRTATNTFTLTVNPVNDAPSFALGGDVVAAQYLAEQAFSNQVSGVILGPTSDETNQSWSATASLSPGDARYFVRPPAIDKNGTLKFTPGTNSGTVVVTVRVKDSGGRTYGGHDTSDPQTFGIVIPDNPFPSRAGEYNGLFYPDTGVEPDKSGFVWLTVDGAGLYRGYLLLAGASNQFSGQFAVAGTSRVTIAKANLTLDLTNDVTGASEAITGTVTNSSMHWVSSLDALRSVIGTDTIVPAIGDYTLTLLGYGGNGTTTPAGDAVLRLSVDDSGQIAFGGQLADGTTVTQRVAMSRYAQWPLYLPAYTKGTNGLVLSWVTFVDDAATNSNNAVVSNNVAWVKTAGAGGAYFSSGFNSGFATLASAYYSWDGLWTPTKAILGGGNLAAPITNTVTVAYDTVTVSVGATNQLKLAIDPGAGFVTGSFVDPASHLTNRIYGVVLQSFDQARGYFLGTNASGYFLLK